MHDDPTLNDGNWKRKCKADMNVWKREANKNKRTLGEKYTGLKNRNRRRKICTEFSKRRKNLSKNVFKNKI